MYDKRASHNKQIDVIKYKPHYHEENLDVQTTLPDINITDHKQPHDTLQLSFYTPANNGNHSLMPVPIETIVMKINRPSTNNRCHHLRRAS